MRITNNAEAAGTVDASPPKAGILPGPRIHGIAILAARVCAALALVAATTFFFSRLAPANATTVGFFYLVVILLIATAGGLVESTIASVAAMLCFNFFFLPPFGTFTIADPHNWVAFFAFLATSLTASQLSARAKRQTQEAVDRQNEMERLYSLSRALLLTDAAQPVAKQVVKQISGIFEFAPVALFVRSSGEIHQAGAESIVGMESSLREAAARSTVIRDESNHFVAAPIRLGGEPIGSLAVEGVALSEAALNSLLNLVAIALERETVQKALNRAEVAHESEELKSTLLDAIAHEFKTPLTSIKAAATELLLETGAAGTSGTRKWDDGQRELIGIVDESADRLSKLVTDAIQLARIEGGTFRLNLGVYFPGALIAGALKQMKPLTEGRAIEVSAPDGLPPVEVDANLLQIVLTHLLDNALKYSPPSEPVRIGARAEENRVLVSVRDRGPGIPEEEQAKIFEKFHRGRSQQHLRGSGMGLAIAQQIMRAHGGEIRVTSRPGEGSEFSFTLPVAPGSSAQ